MKNKKIVQSIIQDGFIGDANGVRLFNTSVNNTLKNGWCLKGKPVYDIEHGTVYQQFVKYEEEHSKPHDNEQPIQNKTVRHVQLKVGDIVELDENFVLSLMDQKTKEHYYDNNLFKLRDFNYGKIISLCDNTIIVCNYRDNFEINLALMYPRDVIKRIVPPMIHGVGDTVTIKTNLEMRETKNSEYRHIVSLILGKMCTVTNVSYKFRMYDVVYNNGEHCIPEDIIKDIKNV